VPIEQYGTSVNETDDSLLVKEYANKTQITLNGNDLYLVFVGDGVQYTSNFKDSCGYHTSSGDSVDFKYGLIAAFAALNNETCAPLNGPYGALIDGPIATGVHEIIEAASDPTTPSAWTANIGQPNENADNCDPYLNQQPLASDSTKAWNIQIGNNFFLIVANWDNVQFICVNPNN